MGGCATMSCFRSFCRPAKPLATGLLVRTLTRKISRVRDTAAAGVSRAPTFSPTCTACACGTAARRELSRSGAARDASARDRRRTAAVAAAAESMPPFTRSHHRGSAAAADRMRSRSARSRSRSPRRSTVTAARKGVTAPKPLYSPMLMISAPTQPLGFARVMTQVVRRGEKRWQRFFVRSVLSTERFRIVVERQGRGMAWWLFASTK